MVSLIKSSDLDCIKELTERIAELEQENQALKAKQVEIDSAKQLYLQIFENFPALIWRARPDKLCDYFNTTWLNFTGRTLEQEFGNGWAEGVHPEDLERCIQIYTSAFDKRESFCMDYRLRNYRGEYRWIKDFGQPYYDTDKSFLGYIGSCYDITENRENEERLRKLSTTDHLTQIANRIKLNKIIELEIVRARRFKHALSIIMIDVDDFKSVNDSFGHQTGDSVLKSFAECLKLNIREIDVVGRWGGEEFLIICPETELEGARNLAIKLKEEIHHQKFPNSILQTASFGVTSFNTNDSSKSFIGRADKALYNAKNKGRDRVETLS